MCKRYVIHFKHIPLVEEIVKRVRKNTGLNIFYAHGELDHEFFKKSVEISFYSGENMIMLYCFNPKMSYLEGHILQALVDLGGYCSKSLPSWTKMPYIEYDKLFSAQRKFR